LRQLTQRAIRLGICGLIVCLAALVTHNPNIVRADGAQLTINPSTVAPGDRIIVSGSGFSPNEAVTVYTVGNPVVMAITSLDGTFSSTLNVPADAPTTTHGVLAIGDAGDYGYGYFTVDGSGSPANPVAPPQPMQTPAPPQPMQTPAPAQPTATATTTTGAPSSGVTSNGCPITAEQTQAETYLLNLLNQHRAAAGAPPLQLNQTIAAASRAHSCDIFQHQRLNHDGSDGSSPFQRIRATGVTYSTAGENIGMAGGYGLDSGIDAVDSGMMSEPLSAGNHHWNIVNPGYTQVGIGVIYANGQVWLTEDFIG